MKSSRQHSRLDKSWADTFSNKTFIKNLNPESITNIFLGTNLPSKLFFPLVHESTHHWTYLSGIGSLLYFYLTKAYSSVTSLRSIEPQDISTDTEWDILSDYLRYEVLAKVYEPLSEGMALFAEYDTYPTDTEAIPTHLVRVCYMFSGKNYITSDITMKEREKIYTEFLIKHRIITGKGIEQKKDLLISSLDIKESPYLAGYQLLKNLQRIISKTNSKYMDTNLFLYFIKEFFFNDTELIELLLDDTIKDELIYPQVINHFQKRLKEAIYIDPTYIDNFEEKIVPARSSYLFGSTIIDYNTNPTFLKLGKIMTTYAEKNEEFQVDAFLMRSFLRVTQLNCYVRISEDAILVEARLPADYIKEEHAAIVEESMLHTKRGDFIDILMTRIPNTLGFPNYEGPCVYEKYTSAIDYGREFNLFITNTEVKFCHFSNTIDDSEKAGILHYFSKEQLSAETMLTITTNFLKDQIVSFDFTEQSNNVALDHLQSQYDNLALAYSEESKYHETVEKMKQYGYWSLLDHLQEGAEKEQIIHTIATLSMCSSRGIIEASILAEHVNIQEEHIEDLQDCFSKNGLNSLRIDDPYVIIRGI